LLLAINHPQKVKKAVAFAANLTADTIGLYSFFEELKRDRRHADEMIAKKDTT